MKVEREILSSFEYSKNISLSKDIDSVVGGATAYTSLARRLKLTDNHVDVELKTQFRGRDLKEVKSKLREQRSMKFSAAESH